MDPIVTETTREQITAGAQATLDEKIGNDGSHAATNDLTTEQLFEMIRKQNEQIATITATFGRGTELKVLVAEKTPEIPKDGVKHKKKNYDFTMPVFMLPPVPELEFTGGKYTAEEAATDTKVIEAILAIKGQGILKERV